MRYWGFRISARGIRSSVNSRDHGLSVPPVAQVVKRVRDRAATRRISGVESATRRGDTFSAARRTTGTRNALAPWHRQLVAARRGINSTRPVNGSAPLQNRVMPA